MNHMRYKGYLGSVRYDDDDGILSGKIEFINDLVSYEAETIADLRNAFREAVYEYLEDCRNLEKEPDATFKGSFNVRVTSDLHRDAAMAAKAQGVSLNSFVSDALESFLGKFGSASTKRTHS